MTELQELNWKEFSRVLIVVAHPDDAEYGLSAAVNRWSRNDIEVNYLLLTRGEAGIRPMDPAEAAKVRAKEQQNACDAVGAHDLTFLDYPDSRLEMSLELRRDIAAHIRKVKPDTVITANFNTEAYGGFNQADHRVAGQSAVDAVSAADNPWALPDLETEPWGASRILVFGAPDATHVMPVEEEDIQAGVKSLAAHEAYWDALPDNPAADSDNFIRQIIGDTDEAKAAGRTPGPAFRVFEL